tara:strand:+ start:468 stop:1136 length:669 start_codon:yes stop_codon:yes gene_type:complete
MVYKKIFMSGTNTEVGKTYITENLLSLCVKKQLSVIPFKPIETGCKITKEGLQPSDAYKYYKILKGKINIDLINPYRFRQPISPNMAIKIARKNIKIKNYIDKLNLLPKKANLFIEGAGGLCSPISSDGLNIDLIKKIRCPVVLVAKDEIGVINNVLLSLEMLKKYRIKTSVVVLNRINTKQPKGMDNLKEISSLIRIPIVQVIKGKNNLSAFNKILKIINF